MKSGHYSVPVTYGKHLGEYLKRAVKFSFTPRFSEVTTSTMMTTAVFNGFHKNRWKRYLDLDEQFRPR